MGCQFSTRGALLFPLLFACGAPAGSAPAPIAEGPGTTPTAPATMTATTATPVLPASPLEQLWSRVRPDLVACYEAGRRAVPEMVDGKMTIHASIDAGGKTLCVVPGDDLGLTQEVEDCMRERIGRETYPASKAEWSISMPVLLRQGALSLGGTTMAPTIESVDSRGLTEEIYDVVEGLLPATKECLRGLGKSGERRIVVVVGARVASDGAVACALASSTSVVPPESRRCVADVFKRGRFRPPKHGVGLLSVPIEVRSGT